MVKLIENIKEVKKLLNNTPFEFLKQHYTILNDEYAKIEAVLGPSAVEATMQKLGKTREELQNLNVSIKQIEVLSVIEQNTEEHVLEFKPDVDDEQPKQ